MRLRIVFFIVFLSSLVVFQSCGYQPIQFESINNVDLMSRKNNGQVVKVNITLYNPNRSAFTIQDADIDVYLKNAYLGKLVLNDTIVVTKKSKFVADFEVHVKRENLFVAGAALLGSIGSGKVELTMKGDLFFKYKFVNKNVKIDFTEKVKL